MRRYSSAKQYIMLQQWEFNNLLFYSLLKRQKKYYATHCCHVSIRAWCSIQNKKKKKYMHDVYLHMKLWACLLLSDAWRCAFQYLVWPWNTSQAKPGSATIGCSSTIKHKENELYIHKTKVEINWSLKRVGMGDNGADANKTCIMDRYLE